MKHVAALLSLLLIAACATLQPQDAPGGRQMLSLDKGWQFHFAGSGPAAADFGNNTASDRSDWRQVDVPHTWNHFGEYKLTRSNDIDNKQGVGWYRRVVDASALPAGERHFLQFDGVGNLTDVWVNGVHVGSHAGAFSRFRFDITDQLHAGENVIVVRADNSPTKPGETTADIIPLSGDFFIHGGIYRHVAIVSVPPAHISLSDHGGPGLYAHTAGLTDQAARIETLTRFGNQGAARNLSLDLAIIDADGQTVASITQPVSLTAHAQSEAKATLTVPDPHRWNGRADPYLYRITATLRDGATLLDSVTQPLGIRSYRIDADKGFFLNGKHLALHGVSRHQDRMGVGWALTDADHDSDMAMIEQLGANTIRFAHYQHAPRWYRDADKAGMVVWSEIPFVDRTTFLPGHGPTPALEANARQQLIELIRQNYNHPSVVTWGIGNETDLQMQSRSSPLGPQASPVPMLKMLDALAHREDPTRPTTLADCCEDTPGEKPAGFPELGGASDMIGYNRYFGWYYGKPADLGPHLDALHAKHPDTPLSISEFGAGGAISQHTDNPLGGPIQTSGRPHPEEYQSWWHEQTWPQLAKRQYLWADWVWNMFDFSSNIRQEGDATDINDKGLVTFDRKVKKDAFFFYQAHWSDQPVLHINSRRYVHRAYPVTDIRIYSNASEVHLGLNDRDLGTAPCLDRICVMKNVHLAPGINRVSATAMIGGKMVRDTVNWDAPDAKQGLSMNVGDLAGFVASDGSRTGSDNWFDGGTPHRLPKDKAAEVSGADTRLLTGYREGAFDYAIPLPNGRWRVSLLFLDPDNGAAHRFDVTAQDKPILHDFSPRDAADGVLKAVKRTTTITVSDGWLRLRFSGKSPALLSAIAIRPDTMIVK